LILKIIYWDIRNEREKKYDGRKQSNEERK
jgi:hypothetical protein